MDIPKSADRKLIQPFMWRVVGKLGSGSYGAVYLIESWDFTGKTVQIAVKSARLGLGSFDLLKEYRIYQALNDCSEITRCHKIEVLLNKKGEKYCNMFLEYASAGTLESLIGKGLPEKQVRTYTRAILKGLHYMHERGFVHCDLKPENILAFPNHEEGCFELKLADLGLAKEPGEKAERKEWRGWFRGTPLYMSPESVKVGVILPKLDIWSLGCIVVQMVTGRCPWDDKFGVSEEVRVALLSNGAAPKVPENLSGQGKDFLNKCLDRCYRTRWSAKMLLHHPFVL